MTYRKPESQIMNTKSLTMRVTGGPESVKTGYGCTMRSLGLFIRRIADSRTLAGGHVHTYNSRSPLARCETDDCPVLRVFAR